VILRRDELLFEYVRADFELPPTLQIRANELIEWHNGGRLLWGRADEMIE